MGMYVCTPCFDRYKLCDAPSGTGHAVCEICANVFGDWETKLGVHFTWDLDRPIYVKDNKLFVINQLKELKVWEELSPGA